MIFVDSSVWIDYFRGTPTSEAETLDILLGREPVITGDLVLVEVLQGFDSESGFALLFSDRDFDPFVQHLGLRSALSAT